MQESMLQLDHFAMDRIYAIGFETDMSLTALLPNCIRVAFDQVSLPNLKTWNPSRVFVPLFGRSQDAWTLVEHLQSLGYNGDIVVLCPALPKPQLVERELRGLGPGKRLTILSGG